jgi:hypothetical protein
MFAGKVGAYPSEAPDKCFTRVGLSLTSKHYTRLKMLARDKQSSLYVIYRRKKFHYIKPCIIKLFTAVMNSVA